jgi:hypothetical protein
MEDEDDSGGIIRDPGGRANSEPDASVTSDLFKAWRSPRFGRANPECMNNPVWEWLVRTRLSAYWANKEFSLSSHGAGPCWCFRRFGQSKTRLPDGRFVLIGGEHEDFYDPDFCIYNDVVIRRPDDGTEIYGYPKDIFTPTDYHSATLVGDRIIIIGSLGYPAQRKPGTTPIYSLDLQSFAISPMNCTGEAPGWLHKHAAVYTREENAILITGGLLERDDDRPAHVENIDDWKLHLADRRWERMTRRQWKRWDIRRGDSRLNQLYWIGSVWKFKNGTGLRTREMLEQRMQRLDDELGFRPDLDLYEQLYVPPIPHQKLPEGEHEFDVRRIGVNGVTVRYNEQMSSVLITIEGDLPASIAEVIVSDLVDKLSALERKPYDAFRL